MEDTFISFLTPSNAPALYAIDPSKKPLSHAAIIEAIRTFDLNAFGINPHQRVAIALNDGPCLATCLLALIAKYAAVPLCPKTPPSTLVADSIRLRVVALITTPDIARSLPSTTSEDIKIIMLHEIHVDIPGLFHLSTLSPNDYGNLNHGLGFGIWPSSGNESSCIFNRLDDNVLILQTSGTSGQRKTVTHTMRTLIHGTQCVIKTWDLRDTDTNINMMPLFHIGGIVRNLLAPLLSRGSTIIAAAFDASLFCDLLNLYPVTWYYASPTMHLAILQEFDSRTPCPHHRLRLICNAAGGLLPSLAKRLQKSFTATILPSYGMTECMPIATPPCDYALQRPGTSGISAGPEIAIFESRNKQRLLPLTYGHIYVRGVPLFAGYEKSDGSLDKTCFDSEGWFDTGDCGYLDADGYLYITGRSKEIINRGGEVISPMEVEEAVNQHDLVETCMAFSVSHKIFDEVVGIAIVSKYHDRRIDLIHLNHFLQKRLDSSKWPQIIVYMDALPRNESGKVLRINFAQRLNLSLLGDESEILAKNRLYEATCPPIGTPISTEINSSHVHFDLSTLYSAIQSCLLPENDIEVWRTKGNTIYAAVSLSDIKGQETWYHDQIILRLENMLHLYLIPQLFVISDKPIPRLSDNGDVDLQALLRMQKGSSSSSSHPTSGIQLIIYELIIKVLGLSSMDKETIDLDADFFDLGGDSLKLGRLVSSLRKKLGIGIGASTLFHCRKISEIIKQVENIALRSMDRKALLNLDMCSSETTTVYSHQDEVENINREKSPSNTYSQTRPLAMITQLIPLVFLYPISRSFQWTILVHAMSLFSSTFGVYTPSQRYLLITVAILISRVSCAIVFPLVAVACKWIIIGRYKAGMYQLWSGYHLRWWIVEKILYIAGYGIFGWSSNLLSIYFRLLGAKIGKNIEFADNIKIGEFDLISIGDDCCIENSTLRPFCLERDNQMKLAPIIIGKNSVIGLKSIVASGADLPANTILGPLSSSHELKEDKGHGLNSYHSAAKVNATPWYWKVFLGYPIILVAHLISYIPYALCLWGLIGLPFSSSKNSGDILTSLIIWFAQPSRLLWHFIARAGHYLMSPIVYLAFVILVKRGFVGRVIADKVKDRTNWGHFQRWFMAKILPPLYIQNVAQIVGAHYEIMSMIYRALGAKIGKRIYWPGRCLEITDFDLFEVGDDVVFGSRSHAITSDGIESAKIKIKDGSMVADRCVLLPGSTIGYKTVLGTGTLTAKHTNYADYTTWLGSVNGNAILFSHDINQENNNNSIGKEGNKLSSLTPFGRAFYKRQAPYFVFPLFVVIFINVIVNIVNSIYWGISTVAGVCILTSLQFDTRDFLGKGYFRFTWLFLYIAEITSVIMTIQAILALTIDVLNKWILLGRRKEGNYNWDESSYCQKWQIYLTLQSIRNRCYGGHGILNLLTGSAWIVFYFRSLGAKIGRNVCLFASGQPQLMLTEPELVTMNDNSSCDDSSLVAHINSRGYFSLNSLHVGEGCVLRSGSRLLSGANMEDNCMLLEHTLLISGDIGDRGKTYQGWPSEEVKSSELESSYKQIIPTRKTEKRQSSTMISMTHDLNNPLPREVKLPILRTLSRRAIGMMKWRQLRRREKMG